MPNFKYKDIKEQVLNKYIEGFSSYECSDIFGVAASTIRTWVRKANVSRSRGKANRLAGQKRKKHYYCIDCGKEIAKKNKSNRCWECWCKFAVKENSPMYGKKASKEHIKHILEGRKNIDYWWMRGENHWNYKGKNHCIVCGVEIGYTSTYCYRHVKSGNRAPNYKGGVTPLQKMIRKLPEWKKWREAIFKRDNYTCQECKMKSGNGKRFILHPHHIKLFSVIFGEFLQKYNQFSPIEDKETLIRLAINYKPFWDVNNGITLCKDCHIKKHSKKQEEKIC